MTIVLYLLILQVMLGGLDNLLHHEFTEGLPGRPEARRELALHASREAIYAILFIGIAWWEWHGLFAWALAGLLLVEIAVTIADFLVEDRTRKLPPFERALHTVLAILYGAILAVLAPVLWQWATQSSDILPVNYGSLSLLFTFFGIGVAGFALRNLLAVIRLGRPDWRRHPIRAGDNPAPKTVLVTGGTGFVGRALVRALIERGDRVLVLTRHRARAAYRFGRHVRALETLDTIRDSETIDAIVHLAGETVARPWWTAARRQRIVESRTQLTAALMALAARLDRKPNVLVAASAVGIYGPQGENVLAERDRTGTGFMAEICRVVEAAAVRGQREIPRVVRLRIGLVLGRDGGVLPPMALAARLGLGAVLGDGRQWFSWIHIDDLVRLTIRAIDDVRIAGVVNAVAPEPVTQRAFADALAGACGRWRIFAAPATVLRGLLGRMADLLLTGQRVHPAMALRHAFEFRYPTLPDALPSLLERPAHPVVTASVVHFNDDCPVCSREIAHYRRIAARDGANVAFCPIGDAPDALARYGFGKADIERRLCATAPNGTLLVGADAFIALYASLPRYRRLARWLARPLFRVIAHIAYEAVAVPVLAAFNSRRRRSAIAAPTGAVPT